MAKTNKQLMAERAEAADRLISDLNAPPQAGAESGEGTDASGADTTQQPATSVDTAPPSGDASDTTSQANTQTEGELAALKQQVETLTSELEKANNRYSSLQGMFNAKENDIRMLRAMLADLSAQASAAQPAAPAAGASKLVTDKDVEDFGEDLIGLIARVVKQEVAPLMTDVASRVDSVASVASTTAVAQFEARLTELVPDWEQINDDPQFIAWLGNYKRNALNAAYTARDLEGTAEFFNDYLQITAPPAPPAASTPPAPPPPAAPTPAEKLEALAAPGKGRVAPPPADGPTGKIWTPAAVAALYAEYRNKRITTEEFNKQEADLFEAQRDGRYRP